MPVQFIDLLPPDHRENVREELARGGLKTAFSLETPFGWKSIDSPYEPRGEAERMLGTASGRGEHYLVLGCGSGFVAEELLKRDAASVLMVTAVRSLAERTLKRLAAASEPAFELTIAIASEPDLVWAQTLLPFLRSHPAARIVVHPRESKAVPGFYASLEARALHHKWNRPPGRHHSQRRVILPGCDGLLERELAKGFRKAGWEVNPVESVQGKRLTAAEALAWIAENEPSLVFSTNHQGADTFGLIPQFCELEGIPWGTWLLDDPRFILDAEEPHGAGRNRLAFAHDTNDIDSWHQMGFGQAHSLPLATDPELFHPGVGEASLVGRLVFVGSPRFSSAHGYFHLIDQSPDAGEIAAMLEAEILATRRAPSDARVREVVHLLGMQESFDPEAVRRLAAYAVQTANLRYRVGILTALAPLKPVVYGRGWEGLLPKSIEFRDPVDYYNDLPRIYQTDCVHLSMTNLQMRSWPNQRLFDVSAAGSVVITDQLDGLEGLFGSAIERLTYTNRESALELANRLMESRTERLDRAARLRDIVLSKHTIEHRIGAILEEFEDGH